MANSYVDDIKVKISEQYKPPCRISMPMSYAQRLSLNKQLQDTRHNYDFVLERSVMDRMKEWQDIRRKLPGQRKQRVELARQTFDEKIANEQKQAETKLLEESSKPENTKVKSQQESQYQTNYITKNGILMPIPVTNYSSNTTSILKPVPLESQQSGRQAFNLSDFESDTSSPFDNMELKSINDLEELAQVLKSDRTNMYPNTTIYQGSANYTERNLPVNSGYTLYGAYNQVNNTNSQVNTSYNPISTTFSQYNNPYASTSNYHVPNSLTNYSNGYMFNIPPQVTSQVQPSHSSYTPYMMNAAQPLQKSNCKSVPDLVKSLEKELESTRLNDTMENSRHSISSSYTTTDVPVPTRPKSTDSFYSKTTVKDGNSNLLDRLSSEQKHICKNVSLMGFPLDRVVRVCETIGCDQKKIVDHLLALSELLDLGFSENDASEALLKNDNDRDKALDLLIS